MIRVLLPAEFQDNHRRIVLAYALRGQAFSRAEWRQALSAFDLLRDAALLTPNGVRPFPLIYREQVESRYSDAYITGLLTAIDVKAASISLWAEIARQIVPTLTQAGYFQPTVPATQLLAAYCLYWWRSFTLGYALEIEIQRDLAASEVRFFAHNIRNRTQRFSPYDLNVSGFKGDIKSSLYFLQVARTQSLRHDFYITQIDGRTRSRILVVFLQTNMWTEIDGDTLFTVLSQIVDVLPQAARIIHQNVEITVIDYSLWKEKIMAYQKRGE